MDGAYEVVITPRAEASLEEILVYLIEVEIHHVKRDPKAINESFE